MVKVLCMKNLVQTVVMLLSCSQAESTLLSDNGCTKVYGEDDEFNYSQRS